MPVEVDMLSAYVAGGTGIALLLWLLVAGLVDKRRAFPRGAVAAQESEPGERKPARFVPDPRYFVGIWLVIFALGATSSLIAAAALGVAGGAVLALAYRRSGVEISEDALVLGTFGPRPRAPLDEVGAVVAAPKSALGRSFGVYGVADREGRWLAAIRYHTVLGGPSCVAELIARTHMEPTGDSGIWSRPGVSPPAGPLPFVGM